MSSRPWSCSAIPCLAALYRASAQGVIEGSSNAKLSELFVSIGSLSQTPDRFGLPSGMRGMALFAVPPDGGTDCPNIVGEIATNAVANVKSKPT